MKIVNKFENFAIILVNFHFLFQSSFLSIRIINVYYIFTQKGINELCPL